MPMYDERIAKRKAQRNQEQKSASAPASSSMYDERIAQRKSERNSDEAFAKTDPNQWVKEVSAVFNSINSSSNLKKEEESYWSKIYASRLEQLRKTGERYRSLYTDQESVSQIDNILGSISQSMASLQNTGWSRRMTKEQQEKDAGHATFDLTAGQKEIDDLEAELKRLRMEKLAQGSGVNSRPYAAGQTEVAQYTTGYGITNNRPYAAGQQVQREIDPTDDRIRELEMQIAKKKQDFNLAKQYQKVAAYDDTVNNADFDQYDDYAESDDALYNWINNPQFREEYEAQYGAAHDVALKDSHLDVNMKSKFARKGYDRMSASEIAIYNYYYAKSGKKAAQKYLDTIQERLNARTAEEMYSALQDNTAAEIVFGAAVGVDQFGTNVANNFRFKADYIPQSAYQIASGMVREDLADNGPKLPEMLGGASLAQVAYDTVTTSANMAPSILVGVATGVPVLGTATMGLSAAGGAYQQALNEGYDKNQARGYSILVGASEMAMEKLLGGISAVGGNALGRNAVKNIANADTALKAIGRRIGGSALSEFGEEYLQEVLEPVFSNIMLKTDKEVKPISTEALYSGILGMLTGAFMEAPYAIYGETKTASAGRKLKKAGGVDSLAKIGNTFAADTVAYKLAGKVNENTGAYTIGQLLKEVDATLTEQNVNEIAEALMKEGIGEIAAKKYAQAFAYVVEGGAMPDSMVNAIEADTVLAKAAREVLIDSNTTWNQRTQGYNEVLRKLAMDKVTGKKSGKVTPANDRQMTGKSTAEESAAVENSDESSAETAAAPRVKEIVSMKNGTMKLRLEDGSEVDSGDASYSSDSEALVYETVAQMTNDAEVANVLIDSFHIQNKKSALDAQMYAAGIDEAFRYGKSNIPKKELASSEFASKLTAAQQEFVYRMGQRSAGKQVAKNKAAVKKSAKNTKEKTAGKVHFDRKGRTFDKTREASLKTMEQLAAVLGTEFYVYESYVNEDGRRVYKDADGNEVSAPNGFYDPETSAIHIDLNAGAEGNGTMIFTVAHELTHFIKHWSDDKFKVLANFLVKQYGEKDVSVSELVQKQIDKAKRNGRNLTWDEAYEEMVADSMEPMLADGNVVQMMADLKPQDKTLWQKICDWFKNLSDNLKELVEAYKGYKPDSPEGKMVADMQDTIVILESIYADALAEASENFQRAEKNTTVEGGRKYSFGGRNAVTANNSALQQAEQLAEQGVGNETIRQQTGWYKGMDGKWRYEIDDSRMKITDKIINYMQLGELMQHEELYNAYPDLANIDVVFHSLEEGVSGAYNPQFDSIDLSYKLKNDPLGLKDALVHEIQHAIQRREGFTKGATAKSWERKIKAGFDSRRADDIRKAQETERELHRIQNEEPEFYRDMMELDAMTPDLPRGEVDWDTLEKIEDDPVEWKQYDARREELEAKYGDIKVWDMNDLLYQRGQAAKNAGRSGVELYFDTAGEIEARDASSRRSKTVEQRKSSPPRLGNEDTVFAEENAPADDYIAGIVSEKEITENINAIAGMDSVVSINGDEFKMGDGRLLTDVTDFFNSIGGSVYNSRLGDVFLRKRGVRHDLGHGMSDEKAASFAAIPAVLEHGRVAGFVVNKDGKGFDSATVVAPIKIGKEPYMMGVIVHRSNKENRFYVHDVVAIKEEAAPLITGTHNVGETGGATSTISIIRKILAVKAKQGNSKKKLSDRDSDGRQLSEGQQEFFKDSKARYENGSLVTVYHSSPTAGFYKFDGGKGEGHYKYGNSKAVVTFFTDRKEMADTYARDNKMVDTTRNGRIKDGVEDIKQKITRKPAPRYAGQYRGYANIKKPYIVDADGRNWDDVRSVFRQEKYDSFASITDKEKTAVMKLWDMAGQDQDWFNTLCEMFYEEAGHSKKKSDSEKQGYKMLKNSVAWKTAKNSIGNSKSLVVSAVRKAGGSDALTFGVVNDFESDTIRDYFTEQQTTNDVVMDALKEGIYDGVIIKNVVDYSNHTKPAELIPGNLYITFSPEQFKAWDNTEPTKSKDIRYSDRDNASKSYAEITEEQQKLYQREMQLAERKRKAVNDPDLLKAMDDYSDLFTELKELLSKKHKGAATQVELDRIEEINGLREDQIKYIAEIQERLGLNAISQEETEIRESKEALRVAADAAWEREGAEKENKAIEKSGLSAPDYFRKKALKAFKTTTNFNEAGYMLPDGKLLNFSGGERNHRYRDHREIGEIYEATQGAAALNRFLNDGNIRIMAESPGVDIASGVEPTKEQYNALWKFIKTNGVKDGKFFVDFSDKEGHRAGNYSYNGRINADRIINDIKYFYQTGSVRESSGLTDFLSDRDPAAGRVNEVLQNENAKLKEDVQYLKDLVKLQKTVTGGTKFTKTSVEAMAGNLMKANNVKGNKQELAKLLNGLYEYIAKGEELSWDGVKEMAQPAVDWLRKNTVIKSELSQYAREILHDVRTSRISLDESQTAEAAYRYGSYNDYRKAMMGSVIISKDGVPLDIQWQEWASTYPDIFDANITASDMPNALADAISSLRNSDLSRAEYAYHADMIEQDLLQQVYDGYWRVSTLYTVADVKQREINALKGKHRQKMNDLRQFHREKTDQLKQEHRDEVKRIRKEYREDSQKKQQEIIQRYQDSRKRSVENRNKTAMRHKIQNVVKELNSLLLTNDKKRHVPDNLKKAVAAALDLVNMDTVDAENRAAKYADLIAKEQAKANPDQDKIDSYTMTMENILRQGEKMGQRIKELHAAYEEIQNSDDPDIANAYDPVISGAIQELSATIGNTSIKNMTMEQLSDVYDVYRAVLTRVRDANKAMAENIRASIEELAKSTIREVQTVGGSKKYRVSNLDAVRKFDWNNMKPVYAMERIGSSTLTEVFNNVRAGEDTWAKDVSEAREYYLEKSKKYGYDKWDFDKKYRFESNSGIPFELTLEQILSLYAYSKREQAADHLRIGGFVFDSNIETYMEKDGKKSILKYKVNTADAHQITPEIMADIIGKLSKEQTGFVDEMQDYLSTVMGAKGNEVTSKMYGVKLFKEKFYFPLKSAKQFMFEQNEVSGEVRIKNSGFTNKVVAKANNPVILSNFMDVWSGHVNDMSMYHAFTLPLEDFNRVFNYNSPKKDGVESVSVKGTIQDAYSPAAVSYVKQLITDLNGGARTDSTTGVINKLTGMFKKGAVFASLSVVVQQPSAIARAAALVDTKYFIGPKVDQKRHKYLWAEVKKYAPVAIIKEMGYFDTNMGKSTQDFITGKEYSGIGEKAKAVVTDSAYRDELLSKAPALADEYAWCGIWAAVKRETKAKHPSMDTTSEAFLKLCGKRFTEVITKTQVYDSVLARSANMRSKDTGMKMATAFMAEPTTSINMIEDAIWKVKRGDKKYAGKAIGAVVASQILNAILVSFVYAGRDDDEDETYAEKYIGALTGSLADGLNAATYIPFIKDIVSIMQGYDVERSDMAVVSDLWNAWKNLKNDKVSPYRKVENFAGSIAQIFGLPVKNIMRDVRGIYNTITNLAGVEQTTGSGVKYAISGAITGKTVSDKEQLYKARLDGDKQHAARVDARYDDEDSANAAVRAAIKDSFMADEIDEATAVKHMVLYAGMDGSEAHWTMDAWKYRKKVGSDEGYGKYGKFHDAVRSGKNLDGVIKEYTDNGVKASTLTGEITEEFKPVYLEASNSEKASMKTKLISAYVACDMEREDAEEKLESWDFEAEYGFAYSDRKETYLSGNVSKATLVDILIDRGYDEEDAEAQVEAYEWEAAGFEDVTTSAIRNYNEWCEPVGIPKSVYLEFWRFDNSTENDVDKTTGKTIAYSAVKKIMAYINSLNLTDRQKDALAKSTGWADKTIKKYKLW